MKKEIKAKTLIYWPKLTKADLSSELRLGSMIWTSRQEESGIRAIIHSWSTIRFIFEIHVSAQFISEVCNPCSFWSRIRWSANLFTLLVKDAQWTKKGGCKNCAELNSIMMFFFFSLEKNGLIFWGYFLTHWIFWVLVLAQYDIFESNNLASFALCPCH